MTNKMHAGRTAFVSGSGKNIGRSIAVRLAAAGSNVIINGSSDEAACEETADMVRQAGPDALVAMGDMSSKEYVKRITDAALARFGRVDILVNNAARRPHKPFLDLTDEDWNAVVDTALTGSFRTAQAFLPGMIEAGWGRIINFAGMKAMRGYHEGGTDLRRQTRHLGADKGPVAGIRHPWHHRQCDFSRPDPQRQRHRR